MAGSFQSNKETIHLDLIVQSDDKLKNVKKSVYSKIVSWFTESFKIHCTSCNCAIDVNLLMHRRVEDDDDWNGKNLRSSELCKRKQQVISNPEPSTSLAHHYDSNPTNEENEKNNVEPSTNNAPPNDVTPEEENVMRSENTIEAMVCIPYTVLIKEKQPESTRNIPPNDVYSDDENELRNENTIEPTVCIPNTALVKEENPKSESESPSVTDSEAETIILPTAPCTRARYNVSKGNFLANNNEPSQEPFTFSQSTDTGVNDNNTQHDQDFTLDEERLTQSSTDDDDEPKPKKRKKVKRRKKQKKLIFCKSCYDIFSTHAEKKKHQQDHDLSCKLCTKSTKFKNLRALGIHVSHKHKKFHPENQSQGQVVNNNALQDENEHTPVKRNVIQFDPPGPSRATESEVIDQTIPEIERTPQYRPELDSCASIKKEGLTCDTCHRKFSKRKVFDDHVKYAHAKRNLFTYLNNYR